jgi:prevent-host-death family protein
VHVFSTYESRKTKDGQPFQRGINSIQLIKDGNRYWVVTILWDVETPTSPIPASYLPEMTIVRRDQMRTIAAGKFKANCLAIMDEVQKNRETVLITKRGKPVAKLVPAKSETKDDFFDSMKGKAKITGDIVSPAFELDEWEMER